MFKKSLIVLFLLSVIGCNTSNPISVSLNTIDTIKVHDTVTIISKNIDSVQGVFAGRVFINPATQSGGYKYRLFATSAVYYNVYIKISGKWRDIDSIYTSELPFTYSKDTVLSDYDNKKYVWFTFYDVYDVLAGKEWMLKSY